MTVGCLVEWSEWDHDCPVGHVNLFTSTLSGPDAILALHQGERPVVDYIVDFSLQGIVVSQPLVVLLVYHCLFAGFSCSSALFYCFLHLVSHVPQAAFETSIMVDDSMMARHFHLHASQLV